MNLGIYGEEDIKLYTLSIYNCFFVKYDAKSSASVHLGQTEPQSRFIYLFIFVRQMRTQWASAPQNYVFPLGGFDVGF